MKHIGLVLVLIATLVLCVPAYGQSDDNPPTTAKSYLSRYDLAAPWHVIDQQDVWPLHLAFNRTVKDYVPVAWDLDGDGRIGISDINAVAIRVGCTANDACYWR
jgi:hypothetical protein